MSPMLVGFRDSDWELDPRWRRHGRRKGSSASSCVDLCYNEYESAPAQRPRFQSLTSVVQYVQEKSAEENKKSG